MNKPLAALCYLLLGAAAAVAQPVQGSGAEVAWTAPQEGAVLDVAQGTEKSGSRTIFWASLTAL